MEGLPLLIRKLLPGLLIRKTLQLASTLKIVLHFKLALIDSIKPLNCMVHSADVLP